MILIPFPQNLFVKFAHAGLGYLVDEYNIVWHPPGRELASDEIQNFGLLEFALSIGVGYHTGQLENIDSGMANNPVELKKDINSVLTAIESLD